jgi:hypothetical protein
MALTINRINKEGHVKGYTTDTRLYLDEDGKVTEDPEQGRWLLAPAGGTVPEAQAIELGLLEEDGTVIPAESVDEPEDESDLSTANKSELQAEAKARGLDDSGTKKELRERIEAHDRTAG